MEHTVVVAESDDKIRALDEVIEKSAFFANIQSTLRETKKGKEELLIAIKPNIMMIYNRAHIHVGTDPELVEQLARRIREEGYTNIAIVESRNVYTDWFPKRTVHHVAKVIGYTLTGYDLVDLTEEAEPYDYGGSIGEDLVGKTWKNADYRISFQKNKTHIIAPYTLTMKNMFGTIPPQSKYKKYHETIGWDQATLDILRNFPPDFAFIDAFWSSDGMNGAVIENPRFTKTIIGSNSFIAADWVGALKMDLDPLSSPLMKMALDVFGKPEFKVKGSLAPYENWKNSPMVLGKLLHSLESLGITSFIYHILFRFLMDSEFK